MSIDLRLLRHARVLVQHGSFRRTAEVLEIARPSLICSIKDLKAQVGLPLFNRSRSGDDPTDFGRVILQQAIALLAGADQLERWIETGKGLVSAEIAVGRTSCAD